MEEIEIKELFMFFVKKLKWLIIITLLVLGIGSTYTFAIKKPLYKGEITIILVGGNNDEKNEEDTQNDISLNQKLVGTYSEIVKSKSVLKQVKDELKLNYSVDALSSMITVSSVNETEIIKISVSGTDPKEAATIANKVAEIFEKKVTEIFNLENVSVIDKAEPSGQPYNMHNRKDVVIYFLVGIVLSCSVIFVIYYFDTTVKSSEQIENRLGISVIGSVPTIGKKGKK